MTDIIIAVDGFSSCGKSTLSKEIANELNYTYLDTGAMYRAVTLFSLENNLIKNGVVKKDELISKLNTINISFKYNKEESRTNIYLNNINVENTIRGIEVSNNVSLISSIKEVRELLVKQQQEIGNNKRIVLDGRDIGTVVFPNAELKLFMTAKVNIRAERRYKEYLSKGEKISLQEIKDNISERDYLDQNRKESPLKQAEDAIILDNSNMTRPEQLNWVLDLIKNRFSKISKNK